MRSPPPAVDVPHLQVSTPPPPSEEAAPETPLTERESYLQKLREERKLWKRESTSPRPGSATMEVRAELPKPLTPKELFLQGVRRERESAARARLRMAAQDAMVGRRMSTSELDRLGNASPYS